LRCTAALAGFAVGPIRSTEAVFGRFPYVSVEFEGY
jgi:hypothetical protein